MFDPAPSAPLARAGLAGAAAALRGSAALAESTASLDQLSDGATLPLQLAWFARLDPRRRILTGSAYETAKRAMDIAIVVAFSPLILAMLLLCWLVVKSESPSAPAIFVQSRTGRHGRRFRMFKFRTMVRNAEALKASVAAQNKLRWPDFKADHDPRVTRIGRMLRKTSLDELPQVLNVLRGDMSLVGPRPTSFGPETYQEWQKGRLEAMPGLTGLWQIAGRGSMQFDERARLDLAYIERRSLLVDLRILLRTFEAVLRRRGAC